MYAFLSIPILLINLVLSSIALYDIYKHYAYTTFKPRLVMMIVLITSNIPYSIIFVLPDIVNNGFLHNSFLCYSYYAISSFYILKYLGILALTIFISFIMFTKYSVARLNKLGRLLNFSVVIGFLFIQLVVLPLGQAKATDNAEDDINGLRPKRCIANSFIIYEGTCYLHSISSIVPFIASIIFIIVNNLTQKLKKGTSSNTIAYSFLFVSLANTLAMAEWALSQIKGEQIKGKLKWVLLDLSKLVPAVFSLIYLMTEALGRTKNLNFDIRRVLKVTKCRNLYKEYLSDIRAKKGYELVSTWEKVYHEGENDYDIMDRNNLNRKEALEYIEKNLEIDLYGFLMSEAFNDFFVIYNMGGQVEANLTEGVLNANRISINE